jgi:hypothetical protein
MKNLADSLDDILEQGGEAVAAGARRRHRSAQPGGCLRVRERRLEANAVIAPKDRAAGITPAVSKVASGAAEATPYLMVTNLARTLADIKERNIWVVGADERARKRSTRPICLIPLPGCSARRARACGA